VLENTLRVKQDFAQGRYDTGWYEGLLFNMFGKGPEEIGELNAGSIRQGLENLGITNLAPVTEQEFANVLSLWARINVDPEANKGALVEAERRTRQLIQMLQEDMLYNAAIAEEYGTPGQYQGYLRVNPQISELLKQSEADISLD
jgi:hypothetical protein